jgi:chitinase
MRAGKKVAALVMSLILAGTVCLFSQKRIVTYFPEWGIYAAHNYYYPEHVPFTKITHLNYGFIEIRKIGTGNFQLGIIDSWASTDKAYGTYDQTARMGNIRELKYQRDLKNPSAKLMFSVGGWSRCGFFSEMAYTQAGRDSLAASCVSFLRTYGWDGIDIDWEYAGVARAPSNNPPGDQGNPVFGTPAEDKVNFTYLLRDLRSALNAAGAADGKTYSLSIAASAGYEIGRAHV